MAKRKSTERIDDLGEKIGGARKDTAVRTGPRPKPEIVGEKDTRPGWMKRFVAAETIDRTTKQGTGQWVLLDTRRTSKWGAWVAPCIASGGNARGSLSDK